MTAAKMLIGAALALSPLFAVAAQEPAKPAAKAEKPSIYDETADANVLLADALVKAKRDNQRVLVMFGGDWCGWCHKLHALMKEDRNLARQLMYEYRVVMVDTKAPNAPELLAKCSEGVEGVGFPFLAVFDADGKLLTPQKTDPFEVDGNRHDPAKVLAFLEKWKAEPQDATEVLHAGRDAAVTGDKLVFLHFGAPWCGWCHQLEDFLALDDIKAKLGARFVDVKIDVDRMTGGQDVLGHFRKGENGGIPWFAFVDPKGTVVATSDGPMGNVGYPVEPFEIAHFLDMLKKAGGLPEADVQAIEAKLQERAAAIKAPRAAAR